MPGMGDHIMQLLVGVENEALAYYVVKLIIWTVSSETQCRVCYIFIT